MAGFTNPQAEYILENLLLVSSWTQPTTLYGLLGKSGTVPDDTGDIAQWDEPSGAAAYARLDVQHSAASWGLTTGTTSVTYKNGNALSYATATATWGEIAYFGIIEEETIGTGTVLMWGTMSTPKTIDVDDQAIFAIDAISITLD